MRARLIARLVALWLIAPAPAHAAFLSEVAFAYGTKEGTNTNYATPTYALDPSSIRAGIESRYGGYTEAGAVKFALSPLLPAGSSILSATLDLTVARTNYSTFNPGSATLSVSGSASGLGALALADFGTATGNVGRVSLATNIGGGSVAPAVPLVFDVSDLIQSLVDGGMTDVLFQFDDLTQQTGIFLSDPTDPSAALRPQLTIVYSPAAATVPEPGSAMLAVLALGLIGTYLTGDRSSGSC